MKYTPQKPRHETTELVTNDSTPFRGHILFSGDFNFNMDEYCSSSQRGSTLK